MTFRNIAIALLAAIPLASLAATPSSAEVMSKARAKAKQEHKNVLVIFHASWCGWCHKLDDMLESKDAGAAMKKAYVIVHLTVDEAKDKKDLENPGASEYRNVLGGATAGLPFFAVVSPTGQVLGDSMAPKTGNTGYPAAPHEIDYFMGLFAKTSPNLKPDDRGKVEKYLREMGAKLNPPTNAGGG
jgi:hypothetical protein